MVAKAQVKQTRRALFRRPSGQPDQARSSEESRAARSVIRGALELAARTVAELCETADPKTRLSAAKLILEVGMPPGHEDDAIQAPLDLRAMPPAERAVVLERRAKQLLELAALDRAASNGVEVIDDEPAE